MATLNELGNITARCPGCQGALSSYEWIRQGVILGAVTHPNEVRMRFNRPGRAQHRLYRCAGCGRGALALIYFRDEEFPNGTHELVNFVREVGETLKLPKGVPDGIAHEFREAEDCQSNRCYRAAAGLFRSVLDKTLRANGYKLKPGTNLEQQIDAASHDGIITEARRRRAHDEIRVLGNDVLHDEWKQIPPEDVEAAHHYVQRILEDFYDERASTLKVLREKSRVPDEDKQAAKEGMLPADPKQ